MKKSNIGILADNLKGGVGILADNLNTIGSRDAPTTFYIGSKDAPTTFYIGSKDAPTRRLFADFNLFIFANTFLAYKIGYATINCVKTLIKYSGIILVGINLTLSAAVFYCDPQKGSPQGDRS